MLQALRNWGQSLAGRRLSLLHAGAQVNHLGCEEG